MIADAARLFVPLARRESISEYKGLFAGLNACLRRLSLPDVWRPFPIGAFGVPTNTRPAAVASMRGAVASVALATVAILTYVRLYFGVDFTDESFYAAVPYRFVLGARPLIDETNIVQQTPGVLLYPFVLLWNSVVGTDGIILYARHLHLVFAPPYSSRCSFRCDASSEIDRSVWCLPAPRSHSFRSGFTA